MKTRPPSRRVLVVLAALCLCAGAASLAAGLAQAGAGGYTTTPSAEFRTGTAALLTDEIDVDTGLPADPEPDVGELGRIRVHVVSSDPSAHLFVGIGDRDTVHAYLAGTAHDEFAGATTDPFRASFTRRPGGAAAPPPGDRPIWVARSAGGSDVTLEWDKTAGPWSLVVADTSGRPGLDVRADLGVRFGFLIPLGAGLLAFALLVLTVAAGRIRTPSRRP